MNNFINIVKKDALDNDVPIMQDETIEFIKMFIINNNIKNILEIGTGIAYSALNFLSVDPEIKVTTIERDEERYLKALNNFKSANVEDRVTLEFKDALEFSSDEDYDLIILDGAKGQNINFFEKFKDNLKEDGFIITDNMFFHGYVEKDEEEINSKNLRALVRKIKDYHHFLEENEEFDSKILRVGDGLAISKRK